MILLPESLFPSTPILLILISSPLILIVLVTLLLTSLASIRSQIFGLKLKTTTKQTLVTTSSATIENSFWSKIQTSLYSGRVSHTRFVPKVHHFSYPLFFCFLDLDEVPLLFGKEKSHSSDHDHSDYNSKRKFRPALWPLNYIMDFRVEDHLKNGEGLLSDSGDNSLQARVRRLISERTNGICSPSPDQKIFLLTHLCYFGYCFNPVSFYYVFKKDSNDISGDQRIEAIIAEVSNTPWNEMKCYVLHPSSRDINVARVVAGGTFLNDDPPSQYRNGTGADAATDEDIDVISKSTANSSNSSNNEHNSSINYIFNKTFHVSPFMELEYLYDWTFWNPTKSRIRVSAIMIKRDKKEAAENISGFKDDHDASPLLTDINNASKNRKHFSAFFDVHRQNFTPFHLGYQLLRLPVYCFIIQVWIHVEALRLLLKGVVFIPHPEGADTTASRAIAKVMEPVFYLMDWFSGNGSNVEEPKDNSIHEDKKKRQ